MKRIIDSHLDLAWNALSFDRDQTLAVEEINTQEAAMHDVRGRGNATTSLPELRASGVAVCLATILVRANAVKRSAAGFRRTDLDFGHQDIAHAHGHGQLAYYRLLESRGEMRMLRSQTELAAHWREWQVDNSESPIGYILAMEGSDPIVSIDDAHKWWDAGLRSVMLAHYGPSRYAMGTGQVGPLTEDGRNLLSVFEKLGMILDLTHLAEPGFFEALDAFSGPVMASHNNCRALVPGDRQFSDEQLGRLIERRAVIGVALDAWMLLPGWQRGISQPTEIGLDALADHIDHICQLAGRIDHVAIGTDLDGGFGNEQTPRELRRYRDLWELTDILIGRGYSQKAIDQVFYGNWLRYFSENLPSL
ncbi:MAG: membrane dipeptidase [Planctomycetales bacterium]|nr:membrane dipeptidase [Planctomycetales bacterium]